MANVVQSGLFKKIGAKLVQAAEKAKTQELKLGFTNLPGGIPNGIAQLATCGFYPYKPDSDMKKADGSSAVGEFFFRASGIVISPVSNEEGIPVKGLPTSVMVSMFDTKTQAGKVTSLEEQVNKVMDILAGLSHFDRKQQAAFKASLDGSSLELMAAHIEASAPYFRFSTRAGKATAQYPNPKIFEAWHGAVDYTPEGDAVSEGVREARPKPSANGAKSPTPANRIAATGGKVAGGKVAVAPSPVQDMPDGEPDADGALEESQGTDYSAETDLATLVAAAEADDKGAKDRLIELAVESGIGRQEAEDAASWSDVVGMIDNVGTANGEEVAEEATEEPEDTTEEPEDTTPKKGAIFKYYPLVTNKTTGKLSKAKNPLQVEVLTVNETKQLVTLKSLDTKRPLVGADKKTPIQVKWADLVSDEV